MKASVLGDNEDAERNLGFHTIHFTSGHHVVSQKTIEIDEKHSEEHL
jgi:hypothetical protein